MKEATEKFCQISTTEYQYLKEIEKSNLMLKQILDKIYKEKYSSCIVEDELGNIIYPTNKNELTQIKQILSIKQNENLIHYEDINGNKRIFETVEKYDELEILGKKEKIFIKALMDLTYKKDHLTGLDIRMVFEEKLKKYIEEKSNRNETFCYAFLDLDNFKTVNDTFGHSAGDSILEATGNIITRNIRKDDLATRYGGDEFLIVLKDIDYKNTIEKLRTIKNEFKEITIKDTVNNHYNPSSISIGALLVDTGKIDFESDTSKLIEKLKKIADNNLYIVKNQKKDDIFLTKDIPQEKVRKKKMTKMI